MASKLKWNYKVVKFSRGGNGEWFAHKTAATFCDFSEACRYAKGFHAEQQAALGVNDGHKYCVVPRKTGGDCACYRLAWNTARIAELERYGLLPSLDSLIAAEAQSLPPSN